MARTLIDHEVDWGIDRLFDKVWTSAERQGIPWQEVNESFLRYGLEGFDDWWKEGEE